MHLSAADDILATYIQYSVCVLRVMKYTLPSCSSSNSSRLDSCCCFSTIWQLVYVNLCAHGWSSVTCNMSRCRIKNSCGESNNAHIMRGSPSGPSSVISQVLSWISNCMKGSWWGVAERMGCGTERVYVIAAAGVIAVPSVKTSHQAFLVTNSVLKCLVHVSEEHHQTLLALCSQPNAFSMLFFFLVGDSFYVKVRIW